MKVLTNIKISLQLGVEVYPNPADKYLTIAMESDQLEKIVRIIKK